jgi:hypothetical protein
MKTERGYPLKDYTASGMPIPPTVATLVSFCLEKLRWNSSADTIEKCKWLKCAKSNKK